MVSFLHSGIHTFIRYIVSHVRPQLVFVERQCHGECRPRSALRGRAVVGTGRPTSSTDQRCTSGKAHEAELVTGVDHDDALVLCRRVKATLAVGVRLLQALEAALVVASPKQLVEDMDQEFLLDIEVNRSAALRERGIHVGTGEKQMVDTVGTTLQGRDLKASESIIRVVPIRVDAAEQNFAECSHVATSGRAIQLP